MHDGRQGADAFQVRSGSRYSGWISRLSPWAKSERVTSQVTDARVGRRPAVSGWPVQTPPYHGEAVVIALSVSVLVQRLQLAAEVTTLSQNLL